jgi:Domain of unknown function (DUF5615)
MWPPAIVEQLRRRGHDVIADQKPDHRTRYSVSDKLFFDRAQEDERTVVTDNAEDFDPLVADYERAAHHGVVFCSSRQFDRSDPRTIGRLVAALDAVLVAEADADDPFDQRHWLRRVDADATRPA